MSNLELSPAWITIVNKLTALFGDDPDITITYDNDSHTVDLYVDGFMGIKAEAISRLLPTEMAIGNITLKINVIPADDEPTQEQTVAAAFAGNPHFVGIKKESHGMFPESTYALFNKEAIQYYNDDLSKYGGMDTVILADVAKELLTNVDETFYFSTNIE